MARSEAQKLADKKYAEKIKDKHRHFAVNLKVEEYERVEEVLKQANMTKADFIRWAVEKLEGKNKV